MESLQNVQAAMNGGNASSKTEDIIPDFLDAVESDAPSTGYKIFKLVNSNRRGGVYIDGIDDVINPKTGKVERIRLLNGVDTIWQKEQKDITPEYVKNNKISLSFPRGQKIMIVYDWETAKMEFATLCRHNVDNANRKGGSKTEFYQYDPERQAKAAYEKEMLEIEMAVEASKLPDDKVRKMASFLGIQFNDDLGQIKAITWLKKDLMVAAKRDPKRFKECLDSKQVEVQYMVRKAILDAKIDLGGINRNATWANGGAIGVVPAARKPLEYLTELAMTNSKEGKEFFAQLKSVSK